MESWADDGEQDLTADMFERALFDGLPSAPSARPSEALAQ